MTIQVIGKARVGVSADPEAVWTAMKNFADLSWTEGVAEVRVKGEGIGMVRSVRLDGSDDWLDEYLIAVDEERRRISYGIDSGMAGVEGYRASAAVISINDSCAIEWLCSGDAQEEQQPDVQGVLDAMAQRIAELFAARFQ